MNYPNHLAWHETLELHELTAFQANGLMKMKQSLPQIEDPTLKALYTEAINGVETHLRELLAFYPKAPGAQQLRADKDPMTGFYAGDLLGMAKTLVRNYAIAITETATPELRQVFAKHLSHAINLHAKTFNFMYARSFYPAYNFERLLENDVQLANRALSM